jgi:Family of unknown function (DUF5335)
MREAERTTEIPRQDWISFFDSFSLQHDRWLVSLELSAVGPDLQVQAHDIPLQGISADLKEPGADTIMIRVGSAAGGYLTHWIRHPARVILEQTPEGADIAIVIESGRGASSRLRFRSPLLAEQLDGILPPEMNR